MAARRTYDDGCSVAHALDLIGERWALLIVRELILGPKRFTDLREGLPGASPNMLSQRLHELKSDGLVRRRKVPPPAGSWVYELTERGRDLEPVIMQLAIWGGQSQSLPSDRPTSVDAAVLSLRTRFRPAVAAEMTASYELRLGDYWFHALVTDRRFELSRGRADHPDAVIDTTPGVLKDVVHGRCPLDDALRSGELKVHGDYRAVERFMGLFTAA